MALFFCQISNYNFSWGIAVIKPSQRSLQPPLRWTNANLKIKHRWWLFNKDSRDLIFHRVIKLCLSTSALIERPPQLQKYSVLWTTLVHIVEQQQQQTPHHPHRVPSWPLFSTSWTLYALVENTAMAHYNLTKSNRAFSNCISCDINRKQMRSSCLRSWKRTNLVCLWLIKKIYKTSQGA